MREQNSFAERMWFQFTHPGGVRLSVSGVGSSGGVVSIHAPGRGATRSIHPISRLVISFNSRTREGCDWMIVGAVRSEHIVSIHAPGRGATGR